MSKQFNLKKIGEKTPYFVYKTFTITVFFVFTF